MAMFGGGGLKALLDPGTALPIAAALMGGQGNQQNFSNALAAMGPAMQQNQSIAFLKQNRPDLYAQVEAGMPVNMAWQMMGEERRLKAQGAKRGLSPIYGKKNGKTVLGQLSEDGTFTETQLPEGFDLAPGTDRVDLGTAWGIVDRSGQVVSTIPKENYQAGFDTARGKTEGEAAGNAAGALPGVRGVAGLVEQQVNDLKNDPYLPSMLGPLDSRLPNVSANAARVQGRMDQLQGGAFLQARQLLKGGGAITDYEGKKAEAAFARMNAAQSEEDYKAALDEFNAAVQDGVRKLEAQAGYGGSAPQAQAPAAGGARRTSMGVPWSMP